MRSAADTIRADHFETASPLPCARRCAALRRMVGRAGCLAAAGLLAATESTAGQWDPGPERTTRDMTASTTAHPGPWPTGLRGSRVPAHPGHDTPAPGGGAPDVLRDGGVEVLDERLHARLRSLEQRSPRFRAALAIAREGRIPVVIGTPAQVRDRLAQWLPLGLRLGNDRIADFLVQTHGPGSSRIAFIVIRVNLDALRAAARWRALLGPGNADRWLDATTETVLVHEIWGHLIPVLEAGDLTGSCADPKPGQSTLDACAMQRENALREELGLKYRQQYALRLLE